MLNDRFIIQATRGASEVVGTRDVNSIEPSKKSKKANKLVIVLLVATFAATFMTIVGSFSLVVDDVMLDLSPQGVGNYDPPQLQGRVHKVVQPGAIDDKAALVPGGTSGTQRHNQTYSLANTSVDIRGSSPSEVSREQVAIFYDVYISKSKTIAAEDDEDLISFRDVVEEQINQIEAANLTASQINAKLYYITVGRPSAFNSQFMSELCKERNRLNCQYIRHRKYSDEHASLMPLYGHCKRNPQDKVMYIHSKGRAEMMSWSVDCLSCLRRRKTNITHLLHFA